MAKRFYAGAVILFASMLLSPIAADARGMSAGRGVVSGGFRAFPAARGHTGARFPVHHRARHVSFGRFDIRRHDVGRRGVHLNRFHRLGDRYRHGGAFVYGPYWGDAFSYRSPAGYPYPIVMSAPGGVEPINTTGGIGGPLLLRHVCQSEVQIVPATGGGDHEVTVTRCRLLADYPGQ